MPASTQYIEDIVDELIGLDFPLETAKALTEKHSALIENAEHAGRRAVSVADELLEYKEETDTKERVVVLAAKMNESNAVAAEEYTPYRVLHGHDSPDTAFITEDYPFGYHLRCRQRHWIEMGTRGSTKGSYRHAAQTTKRNWNHQYTLLLSKLKAKPTEEHAPPYPPDQNNIHPELAEYNQSSIWNEPKCSTYYSFMFLYLDEAGHVHSGAIDLHTGPQNWIAFRNRWQINKPYCQFSEDQLQGLKLLELASRKLNPTSWAEYQEQHGTVAEIDPKLHK